MAPKDQVSDPLQLGTRVPSHARFSCRHLASVVGSSAVLLGCWAGFNSSTYVKDSVDSGSTSTSCVTFTGHSCRLYNCPKHLNATCANWACTCRDACVNPLGQCEAAPYELLASSFTLRNTKWPDHRLSLDTFPMPTLKVTSGNSQPGKFNLYKFSEIADNPTFIISSADYPDRVVSVGIKYWMYARKLGSPLWDNDPQRMAMFICRPVSNPDALMIGGSKRTGGRFKGHLHTISWMYAAWTGAVWASRPSNDPKDAPEEYWVPEPAFESSQMSVFPSCLDYGIGNEDSY